MVKRIGAGTSSDGISFKTTSPFERKNEKLYDHDEKIGPKND